MDVTNTEISPSTLNALRMLAKKNGKSLEDYINLILESETQATSKTDKENWFKEFDEWMQSLDSNTPLLSDEQISRESIYEEQLQRQR
jgi:hypothetical protein